MKAEKLIQAYCDEVHNLTNDITFIHYQWSKSQDVSGYKKKLERYAKEVTVLLSLILRKKSTPSLQQALAELPKAFARYIIQITRKEVLTAEQTASDLLGKLLSIQAELESLFGLKMMRSSVKVLSGPRLR